MGFFAGHLQPVLKDAATAANEIKDCDWFAPKPTEAAKPAETKPAEAAPAGTAPAN